MKVQVVNWSMHLFAPRNQGPLWSAECVKSLHTLSAVTDVSILHGWVVHERVEMFRVNDASAAGNQRPNV